MYSAAVLILGILPTALMFFFSSVGARHGELNPFRFMGWTLFFGYTLKSVYLAYALVSGSPFRTDFLSHDIIHQGQLAVCVGVVTFLIGYVIADGAPIPVRYWPKRVAAQQKQPEVLYYGVFAVSVALAMVYFYQMGFLTQLQNLRFVASKFFVDAEGEKSSLAFLTLGMDVLVVYSAFYFCFAKNIRVWSPVTLAIVFVTITYMLASRRNGVLLLMAANLMIIGVRANAHSVQAKALRRAIIIGLVILLAFVSAIRKGGGEKGLEDLDFGNAVRTAAEHTFEGAYFLDPAKTAAIMDQTRQHDMWLDGSSLIAFVISPIPRVIWPEKPLVRIGPYIGQEVLQYDNDSGAPPGGVAELYINFGWTGIALGMGLLGAGAALAYRRYLGADDRRFGRVQYVFNMLCIALFLFGDFSLAMLYLIRFVAASYVCRNFWYKMADPRPNAAGLGWVPPPAPAVRPSAPSGLPGVQVAGAP